MDPLLGGQKYAPELAFFAETTFQSYLLKIKKKLPKYISKKHYERKHGKTSYYGQK